MSKQAFRLPLVWRVFLASFKRNKSSQVAAFTHPIESFIAALKDKETPDRATQLRKKGLASLGMLILSIYLLGCIGFMTYQVLKSFVMLGKASGNPGLGFGLIIVIFWVYNLVMGIPMGISTLFNEDEDRLLYTLPLFSREIFAAKMLHLYVIELIPFFAFFVIGVICYIPGEPILITLMGLILMTLLAPIPALALVMSICFAIGSLLKKAPSKKFIEGAIQVLTLIIVLPLSIVGGQMGNPRGMAWFQQHMEGLANSPLIGLTTNAFIRAFSNLVVSLSYLPIALAICIAMVLLSDLLISPRMQKNFNALYGLAGTSKTPKLKAGQDIITHSFTKLKSPLISLVHHEIAIVFSSVSYITNTFMTALMPLFIIIPLMLQGDSSPMGNLKELGTVAVRDTNLGEILLLGMLMFSMLFFTTVASTCLNREGQGLKLLKRLPISTKRLLTSYAISNVIFSIPSFIMAIIFASLMGIAPIHMLPYFVLALIILFLSVGLGLYSNCLFINISWQTEQECMKRSTSSIFSLIFFFGLFFSLGGFVGAYLGYNWGSWAVLMGILAGACMILALITWLIVLPRVLTKKLKALELYS